MFVCFCVCLSVCLSVCLFAPSDVVFFRASHWPWDHMFRSRPLNVQPYPTPQNPPKKNLFFWPPPKKKFWGATICIGQKIQCLPYLICLRTIFFLLVKEWMNGGKWCNISSLNATIQLLFKHLKDNLLKGDHATSYLDWKLIKKTKFIKSSVWKQVLTKNRLAKKNY